MKSTWTNKEIKYVIDHYPYKSCKEVAEALNRSLSAVYGQAFKMEIKKSPEYMEKMNKINGEKLKITGAKTRYPKGHKPANKGKKMPEELKEKVSHTFFKKGNKPHNSKYDGAITLRKDKRGVKYAHIRLSKAKWEMLHRYLWELHNGPIPKGKIVAFKDGNASNCIIDNLYLITREENMKRNTIHNYPDNIKSLIYLKSQLTRKINNYGKKQNERSKRSHVRPIRKIGR